MNSDKISIIVPIYNVEIYLERCISSIVSQSYSNLEIILVDDGSLDQCPKICDVWAEKDKRIKVIHKKNGGLSDARNVGLKIASGKYIGFIDSDDYIASEMYEKLYQSMVNSNSDVSACSVMMVWENEKHTQLLTSTINKILDRNQAQKALLDESDLKQPVWYKLYKAELIKDTLFEVGKQHEDVYWSYQVIGKANTISIIDYVGYYYVQRSSSIMGVKYSEKRLDAIEAICRRQEYFIEKFPFLIQDGLINIYFQCLYQGQQALKMRDRKQKKNVFRILKNAIKKYPLTNIELNSLPFSYRMWIKLENKSLFITCFIRNLLNIGL